MTRKIPADQFAVVGANIRTLRLRRGWSQSRLGELMGWSSPATVCAAEGHRGARQRGFTFAEIMRLAAIFDVHPRQLMTACENCQGQPPTGFACIACGAAAPIGDRPAALIDSTRDGHAAVASR